ncbi:phosphatase PAP2 family protein [Geotalea sp. SG265]|uniref:phosphatase PAP2 family protein n=1 Tax=Geotalea sp. SG265 TaxID=2922867 RepID=UPI001FAF536F|nr:phosphatase PAP2 family protein [Geotalea sp. SG265]
MSKNKISAMQERNDDGLTMTTLSLWFLPTAIIVSLAILFLDRPVGRFIQEKLYSNRIWGSLTGQLPDTLLIMVGLITVACYAGYRLRKHRHIQDAATVLLHYVAYALPASFVAKTVLKVAFGRIETRYWLQNPQQYGFHWLHGGEHFSGFPSGHMAVFATLFAAIWRMYPRLKGVLCLLLLVLGLLLLATNYHFLSDVVAGTYLGLVVEAMLFAVMGKEWLK